jgi:hypothetical protein
MWIYCCHHIISCSLWMISGLVFSKLSDIYMSCIVAFCLWCLQLKMEGLSSHKQTFLLYEPQHVLSLTDQRQVILDKYTNVFRCHLYIPQKPLDDGLSGLKHVVSQTSKTFFCVMIILQFLLHMCAYVMYVVSFCNRNFYGRSGVCLALHITPEKPSGWEYSVFVFLCEYISF